VVTHKPPGIFGDMRRAGHTPGRHTGIGRQWESWVEQLFFGQPPIPGFPSGPPCGDRPLRLLAAYQFMALCEPGGRTRGSATTVASADGEASCLVAGIGVRVPRSAAFLVDRDVGSCYVWIMEPRSNDMKRWQIKTTDTRNGNELCTTEMPHLGALGLPGLGYAYESCLFRADGDSDVLGRYQTREEAEAGHAAIVREVMWGLAIEHE